IGEYTFLLVNKEMAEKYSYDKSEFSTFNKALSFVADVSAHEPTITPIVGDPQLYNFEYFALDPDTLEFTDKPSVVAAQVYASSVYSDYLSFRNIFKIAAYKTQIKDLMTIKLNNYYDPKANLDEPFLVGMMKGGAELMDKYSEDYHTIVLETPKLTEKQVYAGMFGVTEYTKDLTRSMEIVTYLNTNSELRNILQYGIENVNYTLDPDTGALTMLNDTYSMDLVKTGNAFVAYHPEKGNDPHAWDAAKRQNLDAVTDLLYGFSFVDSDLDKTLVAEIEKLSEECFKKIDACKTMEELEATITELDTMLTENEKMLAFSSARPEYVGNAYHIYTEWHTAMWPPEG
ncbi:MAG: hypothetical protein IKL84_04185, partial [Clostridia bacterium]|nr:hypothetical protein [Clostridia bacterium]